MRIHSQHAGVVPLVHRWQATQSANEAWRRRKSEALQRELMLELVEPELRRFNGELVLLYHKFLTMVPSGEHSFVHGSTMMSQDVYWTTVGRIDEARLRRIRAQVQRRQINSVPCLFRTSPKFLVALRSASVSLEPRYAQGMHQPYFVVREKKPGDPVIEPRPTLDLSELGDHLFALHNGRHDWARKIEIVLGTKSVHAWLKEHGSEATYWTLRFHL